MSGSGNSSGDDFLGIGSFSNDFKSIGSIFREMLQSALTNESMTGLNGYESMADLNVTNQTESSEGTLTVPEPVMEDYFIISYDTFTLLIGAPMNVLALYRLLKAYQAMMKAHQIDLKAAFTLLKIHLNISNLMILLFYNPTCIAWLVTYQWLAGDAMCRIMQFLCSLSFQTMSNVVASIAVDRLRNVCRMVAMTDHSNRSSSNTLPMRAVKVLLGISWAVAIATSGVQLFVWRLTEISEDWTQCTTIWDFQRASLTKSTGNESYLSQEFFEEDVYLLSHLLVIFWLPLAIIVICYVLIVEKLLRLSCTSFSTVPRQNIPKGQELNLVENPIRREQSQNEKNPLLIPPVNSHLSENSVSVPPYRDRSESSMSVQTKAQRINTTMEFHSSGAKVQLNVPRNTARGIPDWRIQMRSKMFRTSALVVGAYVLLWLPYNTLSLCVYMRPSIRTHLSEHWDWLKSLKILNTIVNPFIYEFGRNC